MKTVGITRRIDELGRIVIPKEIRKAIHINAGDLLAINLDSNSNIILKKHSLLENEEDFVYSFINFFSKVLKADIYISDKEKILYSNKTNIINRKIYINKDGMNNKNIIEDITLSENIEIFPLLPNGDNLGYLIFNFKNASTSEEVLFLIKKFVESYLENE